MFLKQLKIKNFRALADLTIDFHKGVNILIGENNAGKTTVLDALRICFGLGSESRDIYLRPEDFYTNPTGAKAENIEFHMSFDPTTREQGIFYELLAIVDGKAELQLHVRIKYDPSNDRIQRTYWGGATEGQTVASEILQYIYSVYLGALRDATRDLNPRRGNQLSKLFGKLVEDEDKQKEYALKIREQIKSIEEWNTLINDGKEKINDHLSKVCLSHRQQIIDIDFVESEFRRIVEGLKVHIPMANTKDPGAGDPVPQNHLQIWQNGLGYNNLIYISTVLGDLLQRRIQNQDSYISLLIEEPEAHLHPQLQNVLFQYLQDIETRNIQIFITSHSPTITAKTNLDSIIVLSILDDLSISSTPLEQIDISPKNKRYLHRFLDVTKSQLFFAKGIIFVEGISEALLLPDFAKIMGEEYCLDKNGVEIVNINGVAFEPFVEILKPVREGEGLGARSAILTDEDQDEKSQEISPRATKAFGFQAVYENLKVLLASQTFEYELYLCNEDEVLLIYKEMHTGTNLDFHGTCEQRANEFAKLIKRNEDKALFAQNLSYQLNSNNELFQEFIVPKYIRTAILWVIDGKSD